MRYKILTQLISGIKPKRILEIGVFDGTNSLRMIEEALKYNEKVEYHGFDLFEKPDDEELPKIPPTVEAVSDKLSKSSAEVFLYKGNTRETLGQVKLPKMDFIFIDGGHSLKTIENDWNHCKKLMNANTVVLFDDYYVNREDAGCKTLIDSLSDEYSKEFVGEESVYPEFTVRFVQVVKKKKKKNAK